MSGSAHFVQRVSHLPGSATCPAQVGIAHVLFGCLSAAHLSPSSRASVVTIIVFTASLSECAISSVFLSLILAGIASTTEKSARRSTLVIIVNGLPALTQIRGRSQKPCVWWKATGRGGAYEIDSPMCLSKTSPARVQAHPNPKQGTGTQKRAQTAYYGGACLPVMVRPWRELCGWWCFMQRV